MEEFNLNLGVQKKETALPEVFDVIIIGGGPAGLTAAIYNSRARMKTLIIEKQAMGGQVILTSEVEDYPGFENVAGITLVQNMEKQARNFGTHIVYEEVEKIMDKGEAKELHCASGKIYKTCAVIIASGAGYRQLGALGEIRFRGKGVSYCGTCDGAFFRNQEIAVVGGGDTALEEAVFLTRFAKKVSVIHRRDTFRGAKIAQEKAFANPKIEFIYDTVVEEIAGDRGVEKVKLKNIKNGKVSDLAVTGVFIFVGLIPNTIFLKGFVKMDEAGYVEVNAEMKTSVSGVFSCGDCNIKTFRQIVTACGDGAVAAYSAQHYVDRVKGTEYI